VGLCAGPSIYQKWKKKLKKWNGDRSKIPYEVSVVINHRDRLARGGKPKGSSGGGERERVTKGSLKWASLENGSNSEKILPNQTREKKRERKRRMVAQWEGKKKTRVGLLWKRKKKNVGKRTLRNFFGKKKEGGRPEGWGVNTQRGPFKNEGWFRSQSLTGETDKRTENIKGVGGRGIRGVGGGAKGYNSSWKIKRKTTGEGESFYREVSKVSTQKFPPEARKEGGGRG